MTSTVKVWLGHPDAAAMMGGLPAGVELDPWDGDSEPPESLFDVEFVVTGFGKRLKVLDYTPQMPRLRVVQTCVSGYEHVIDRIPDGVTFCNAMGVHDPWVAEWIVAATLAMIREFPEEVLKQAARVRELHQTDTLYGKTVLILGYGSIGVAVEERLKGFGVKIIRVASHARDGVYGPESLPELLPLADVVIPLLRAGQDTDNYIDADFLAQMHDGALLVNAARGSIVDQDALLAEVRARRLRAALDVSEPFHLPPDHPLLTTPGVFYTPHRAGPTLASIPGAYALAGEQLRRYLAGEPLKNVVKAGSLEASAGPALTQASR